MVDQILDYFRRIVYNEPRMRADMEDGIGYWKQFAKTMKHRENLDKKLSGQPIAKQQLAEDALNAMAALGGIVRTTASSSHQQQQQQHATFMSTVDHKTLEDIMDEVSVRVRGRWAR